MFNRAKMTGQLMRGTAAPAYGMLSAGTFAYDKSFEMYPYDPGKGKETLHPPAECRKSPPIVR
jgi:ABC-type transport system substrate-binding protein